jgi:hypothetical protein
MDGGKYRCGPEWDLLEAVARTSGDEQTERIAEFVRMADFDWGRLLLAALTHKMLPLVGVALAPEKVGNLVPPRVRYHLEMVVDKTRYENGLLRREAVIVCDALGERGIPVAVWKGVAFDSLLYGGHGDRFMVDVDFLVCAEDIERVVEILGALGYVRGEYEWRHRKIRLEESEPSHLTGLVRLTDDPIVRDFRMDFATSVTWRRGSWRFDVEEALEKTTPLFLPGNDASIPQLDLTRTFVSTVLHLFQDCAFDSRGSVDGGTLLRWADLIRMTEVYGHQLRDAELGRAIEESQLGIPVCWVLGHLDRLFDAVTCADMDLEVDGEIPLQMFDGTGGVAQWDGDLRRKMVAKAYGQAFPAVSSDL